MLFDESLQLIHGRAISRAKMQPRFLVLPAKSTVFFDPPVKVGFIENNTVASLSRTFHSVR
jgi:hypothetical protein